MAKILENRVVADDFCLMRVEADNDAKMGQFYMLRAWDSFPVLSRPISVFDSDGRTVSFLYKVVGQGTERFRDLKPGELVMDTGAGYYTPAEFEEKYLSPDYGGGASAERYGKEN